MKQVAARVAAWVGFPLQAPQLATLSKYRDWLVKEAIPAGGLGPEEADRVWSRHVADSLTFAACWPRRHPPPTLLDVGSGVGLPGIPLAVLWPATSVTLLDRSGRRCELARRAWRVLGLGNVSVVQSSADRHRSRYAMTVIRALVPPQQAVGIGARLTEPAGIVAVGLSRTARPDGEAVRRRFLGEIAAIHPGNTVDLVSVPAAVLDSPAWLLRMTATASTTRGQPLD